MTGLEQVEQAARMAQVSASIYAMRARAPRSEFLDVESWKSHSLYWQELSAEKYAYARDLVKVLLQRRNAPVV